MIRRANEGYGGNTVWNGGGASSDPGAALRRRIDHSRLLVAAGKISAARGKFPYYQSKSNGQA